MIPYSRQSISEADVQAVVRALNSDWLTQGPAVAAFEKALASRVGSKYCVAFNSGTASLHAAYFSAGAGEGDEVIVPALTFAATSNAALYLGAKPVFADIGKTFHTIDVKDVEKKITSRTKIIAPVDYGGRPCDMRELKVLARKHNCVLIEDAAHSLGATYRDKQVGSLADMTMFSFHPLKSITTGEGGAIVTNDKNFYQKLILFRSHGITKDPLLLTQDEGPWYQEMQVLGFNYRITDIQAALGTSQLKRLDSFIKKRHIAVARYNKLLANIPGVSLPAVERAHEVSAWHLYPILVDPKKRRTIFEALRAADIGVQVHYLPVYLHPYYQTLGYEKGLCPNAELFYKSEISLPLFPDITSVQQKYVADTLRTTINL